EVGQNILAYVGCIAGAILCSDYEQGLRAAGFASVHLIDTGKDLNVYAQVEGQSGCCSPAAETTGSLPLASSCCATSNGAGSSEMHLSLAELFRKYNVNDYAASVQVYALKST